MFPDEKDVPSVERAEVKTATQKDETQAVTAEISSEENKTEQKKDSHKKIIIALICVLACGIGVFFAGKMKLKNALIKEWYALDDSETIIRVLDIDEDEIEYRFITEFAWLNTTLERFDWRVVSWNKIELDWGSFKKTYTIEIEDNHFWVTPAITSTDKNELWIHVD